VDVIAQGGRLMLAIENGNWIIDDFGIRSKITRVRLISRQTGRQKCRFPDRTAKFWPARMAIET
jgi:hypothetical protein